MDEIGQIVQGKTPLYKSLSSPAQAIKDLSANTRSQWLKVMTRQQIVYYGQDVLPSAAVFEKNAQAMDAEKSKRQDDSWKITKEWQKLAFKAKAEARALARVMHESTLLGEDPSESATSKSDPAAYNRVLKQYNELSTEAQALYKKVKKSYRDQRADFRTALEARIKQAQIDDKTKAGFLDALRLHFESGRQEPYFPLARFGDRWVWAEKAGQEPVYAMFERQQEQRAFADSLRAEGYTISHGAKLSGLRAKQGPSGSFIGDLTKMVDTIATKGAEAEALKDGIYQMYLESLPELSVRKHFIHRQKRQGFTSDAMRAYASQLSHGASQIARLMYGHQMADSIDSMSKEASRSSDPNRAGDVLNALDKSYEWAMNPNNASWASKATGLGFAWYLGVSPAAAFVNLTQQAVMTFPELTVRFGTTKAGSAIAAANASYWSSLGSFDYAKRNRDRLEREFSGDMGKALVELERSGAIDKSHAHAVAGLSEEDSTALNMGWRKAMEGVSFLFHQAERANREATAIASYRLMRGDGKPHQEALDYAREVIWKTQFDYCTDILTECLTVGGWKRYNELTVRDVAIAVDEAGRAVESKIHAINTFPGQRPVIEYTHKERRFSMVVTPHHECLVQRYDSKPKKWTKLTKVKAKALKSHHNIVRCPTAPLGGREGIYGEDLAALLGWIAAEGQYARFTNCNEKRNVRLAQSAHHNPDYVNEIDCILDRLGGHSKKFWTRKGAMIVWTLRKPLSDSILNLMPDKLLTFDMLKHMTADEMKATLMAFAKGDGTKYGSGSWVITQKTGKNSQNLEVLQAMATVCGITATLGGERDNINADLAYGR